MQRDGPARQVVEPEGRAEQLGAASSDQSRHAKNFAAANLERNITRREISAEPLQSQYRLAHFVRRGWEELVDIAADHQLDNLFFRNALQFALAGYLAVAQHNVSIAHLPDFLQKMANIDHRHSRNSQSLDHLE